MILLQKCIGNDLIDHIKRNYIAKYTSPLAWLVECLPMAQKTKVQSQVMLY